MAVFTKHLNWFQQDMSATTVHSAAAIPSNTWAKVTIQFCDLGASAGTVRVAISPAGAALAAEHYIYYDYVLASAGIVTIKDVDVQPRAVIRVYSANADVTCNIWGEFKEKTTSLISP